MVESVDTPDLKSCGQQWPCGFDSRSEYGPTANLAISGRFYFHRPQSDVIQRAIRFRPGFNFQTIADRTINFRTTTTLF